MKSNSTSPAAIKSFVVEITPSMATLIEELAESLESPPADVARLALALGLKGLTRISKQEDLTYDAAAQAVGDAMGTPQTSGPVSKGLQPATSIDNRWLLLRSTSRTSKSRNRLTTHDAALELGDVSPSQIRRWCSAGRISGAVLFPGQTGWRIPRKAWARWLRSQTRYARR